MRRRRDARRVCELGGGCHVFLWVVRAQDARQAPSASLVAPPQSHRRVPGAVSAQVANPEIADIAANAGMTNAEIRRAPGVLLELKRPWMDGDVGDRGMVWWRTAAGRAAAARPVSPFPGDKAQPTQRIFKAAAARSRRSLIPIGVGRRSCARDQRPRPPLPLAGLRRPDSL